MANAIETKVTEGQDIEGRVVLSCEVWEPEGSENYAEVMYYSYSDEFKTVFGVINEDMFNAAVAAIKGYQA